MATSSSNDRSALTPAQWQVVTWEDANQHAKKKMRHTTQYCCGLNTTSDTVIELTKQLVNQNGLTGDGIQFATQIRQHLADKKIYAAEPFECGIELDIRPKTDGLNIDVYFHFGIPTEEPTCQESDMAVLRTTPLVGRESTTWKVVFHIDQVEMKKVTCKKVSPELLIKLVLMRTDECLEVLQNQDMRVLFEAAHEASDAKATKAGKPYYPGAVTVWQEAQKSIDLASALESLIVPDIPPCRYFKHGYCKKGKSCLYIH